MQQLNQKIIKAKASFVHSSPRKIRIVADAVRKMRATEAVSYLKLLPQKAAHPLLLVYEQAIGNAKNNFQLSPATLLVKSLQVQDGPRGPKKADVHAHGARFDRGIRRKRLSHILLELESIEDQDNKKVEETKSNKLNNKKALVTPKKMEETK